MVNHRNHEFWIENFPELFGSIQLVPNTHMNLEEKLNTLTRLIIIIFIFLLIFNFRYDFIFLFIFLSLFFIIILYYIQKNIMQQINANKYVKENFTHPSSKDAVIEYYGPTCTGVGPIAPPPVKYVPSITTVKTDEGNVKFYGGNAGNKNTFMQVNPATACTWCHNEENMSANFNNPNYVSNNQILATNKSGRGGLARTKVSPIIAPPLASSEFWKPNDFVIPKCINDQATQELHQSGYVITGCQSNNILLPQYEKCDCKNSPEDIRLGKYMCPSQVKPLEKTSTPVTSMPYDKTTHPQQHIQNTSSALPYDKAKAKEVKLKENYIENGNNIIENYTDYFPYKTDGIPTSGCCGKGNEMCNKENCVRPPYVVGPDLPGDMLTSMGYYPAQLEKHNIPSNLGVGRAPKDDSFNEYHKNIFTDIITPGIYKRNEIIEPISANMGISFTQQFEPVTCEKDCNDDITFVSQDPRIKRTTNLPTVIEEDSPNESNVYDPRFTGSGTSYRSYIDKITGQPRFYYDDVEVHRKVNYITRNNIDFTKFGTTYGPMEKEEFSNQKDIRNLANTEFLNASLTQRTDLQERLMRKVNANAWQQKVAPIRTNDYTRGGGGQSYYGTCIGGACTGIYAGPRG